MGDHSRPRPVTPKPKAPLEIKYSGPRANRQRSRTNSTLNPSASVFASHSNSPASTPAPPENGNTFTYISKAPISDSALDSDSTLQPRRLPKIAVEQIELPPSPVLPPVDSRDPEYSAQIIPLHLRTESYQIHLSNHPAAAQNRANTFELAIPDRAKRFLSWLQSEQPYLDSMMEDLLEQQRRLENRLSWLRGDVEGRLHLPSLPIGPGIFAERCAKEDELAALMQDLRLVALVADDNLKEQEAMRRELLMDQ